MNAAQAGDEIWVAAGTYRPRGVSRRGLDRTATFQLKSDVAIYGGFAGVEAIRERRDPERNETILSGDLIGDDDPTTAAADLIDDPTRQDNAFHVVTGSGTRASAMLDGFVITGGNANGTLGSETLRGGGMYNDRGTPTLANCTFSRNVASSVEEDGGGGAMYNQNSSPVLTNCVFVANSARFGGGMYNHPGSPTLTNCTFNGNWGDLGGGMCNRDGSNPMLTHCVFTENGAESAGGGGGGMGNWNFASPTLINCTFSGNWTWADGGGMGNWDDASPTLINCMFNANTALRGGAMINLAQSSPTLTNCTLNGNRASIAGGGIFERVDSRSTLANCILWSNRDQGGTGAFAQLDSGTSLVTFSCIQGFGRSRRTGNIGIDPRFVDAVGPDGEPATGDENLRLRLDSPCIDAGDNESVPPTVTTDLDGTPRFVDMLDNFDTGNGASPIVDMGAYEAHTPSIYYVDAVNGDNNNNGLRPAAAFASIQKGIDSAEDGDTVLVYSAIYSEEINFLGKALTVQSAADVAVIENPGDFAVSFYNGEGPDSVLKNFIIRNSFMGIFIAGSSPTMSNVTVVDNKYGIEAYASSEPDISNSIFWYNTDDDLFGCHARYSCIERGGEGEGNIYADPLFVDPVNNDYHLFSERGRYWPEHDVWVLDEVTSPCVNSGDPRVDPSGEPIPNGGRINMGAYGGTAYASMSELNQPPLDFDGSFVDGQIVFQQINLALSVPGDWVAAVTKEAKRELRRPSNQSDYVYDAMYDAILPKNYLLFHVGGEEFGAGTSFADVHLRGYVKLGDLTQEITALEKRLKEAIGELKSRPYFSDQPNFIELVESAVSNVQIGGRNFHRIELLLNLRFHDYGFAALIDTYVLQSGSHSYIFAFCGAFAERWKLTTQAEFQRLILESLRLG
ncbi:MAG: hypothetical protein IIC50_10255 [Planctomycetes bacterium]|nr:hypothetical protein [Planctomycetota bacterium]